MVIEIGLETGSFYWLLNCFIYLIKVIKGSTAAIGNNGSCSNSTVLLGDKSRHTETSVHHSTLFLRSNCGVPLATINSLDFSSDIAGGEVALLLRHCLVLLMSTLLSMRSTIYFCWQKDLTVLLYTWF